MDMSAINPARPICTSSLLLSELSGLFATSSTIGRNHHILESVGTGSKHPSGMQATFRWAVRSQAQVSVKTTHPLPQTFILSNDVMQSVISADKKEFNEQLCKE
ncbi:hypothetical protein HDU93_006100, partial [Gonapodya sp. JEL0774]